MSNLIIKIDEQGNQSVILDEMTLPGVSRVAVLPNETKIHFVSIVDNHDVVMEAIHKLSKFSSITITLEVLSKSTTISDNLFWQSTSMPETSDDLDKLDPRYVNRAEVELVDDIQDVK